jgi:hypothetical protein
MLLRYEIQVWLIETKFLITDLVTATLMVGGVVENWPKIKNCPITMKFGDIVGFAFIKM